MKKLIIASTTALLLATSTAAFAEEAKAPADKGKCLEMLRNVGESIKKAGMTEEAVGKIRPMGGKIAQFCNAGDFSSAFKVHKEIMQIISAKK